MSTAARALDGVRTAARNLDVESIRRDFPILGRKVHGKPLVYLDNAATTQKPVAVLDAERDVYTRYYSNVHRGVHTLSMESTEAYEAARVKAQRFINARESREVIFVRGTTEAINLVAQTFGRSRVGEGDEVLISALEHHSNIVPWQMLCEQMKARLVVAPINQAGEIILPELEKRLSPRTRLVAVAHVSNALGTVNPADRIIQLAHARGIPVLLDGAQAVPHRAVDVEALDCDFYAFSGHKIYGPGGVGILYGKSEHLESMPPYQGGGDMISSVTFEKTTYNVIPYKFEAGTPNIAGAIGLASAFDYVERLGLDAIEAAERELLIYMTGALASVPGIRIIGTAPDKAAVISFVLDGIHPHDVGTVLDEEGIAVRTGHHCAQPVMDFYGVPATVRASLSFYNTREEIDALVDGLGRVIDLFSA
jgi:cysteine desulfurase / selenocysteine lyase